MGGQLDLPEGALAQGFAYYLIVRDGCTENEVTDLIGFHCLGGLICWFICVNIPSFRLPGVPHDHSC